MYYRNANCAVVVYDITQSSSLEKARTWIRELQRQADRSIVIALCGNKADLEERRQVTQEEAKKYAEEEGLMWSETSAKSGDGVQEIFTEIGEFGMFMPATTPIADGVWPSLLSSEEAAVDCLTVCPIGRCSPSGWCKGRRRPQQTGRCKPRRRRLQLLETHPGPLNASGLRGQQGALL